jgi:hypothetical protein
MDFTSWWVIWQRYKTNVGWITSLIIAVAVGWQLGRMMSPYYASNPIVLSEVPVETTIAELESLKQTGIAARPNTTKQPTVAGTVTPSTDIQFVASKNSTLYHHISCPSAKRILPANLRSFKTPEEAERAGFSPSKCALEKIKR